MNTIKEVYEQLDKEELGTERSKVKLKSGDVLRIIGKSHFNIVTDSTNMCGSFIKEVSFDTEVEWIGNKPKIKKLYAYIRTMRTGDGDIKYLAFEDKEWFQDAFQWLPEDQYPPIELDSSPQSDQK